MALDKDNLVEFLVDLRGRYKRLDSSIEGLAQRADPVGNAGDLLTWIDDISRRREFVSHRRSAELAEEVEDLVTEIGARLDDGDSGSALAAAERLIVRMPEIIEGVDDSSGYVSDSLRATFVIWLRAAAVERDRSREEDWVARVRGIYTDAGDYGLADDLLPAASILLEGEELRELARQYEVEALDRSTDPTSFAGLTARVALGQVAVALRDPELYARSVQIDSPSPNERQKGDIARTCLAMGEPGKALEWLEGPWQDEVGRLEMCAEVYGGLGDPDRVLDLRGKAWRASGSWRALEAFLELLPKDEHPPVLAEASEVARRSTRLEEGLEILCGLGAVAEAETLLVERRGEIDGGAYYQLQEFAETLEVRGHPLGSTLVHRALLENILDRAYSKAYPHAARYFLHLGSLQHGITDWRDVPAHSAYLES
ncbi:MAG: DUF6880 family protein, partial [Acidobacteriota bacterium]